MILNLFQALFSGLMVGWIVRLAIIPFRWESARKTRILYWTMAGITALMFPFYMGWYQ